MSLKIDDSHFDSSVYNHDRQEEAAQPAAQVAVLQGKILTVITLASVAELKAAQKTVKVWKEIAYERLAFMRAAADEKLVSFREATTDENKSLCKQIHDDALLELDEDRITVEKYCEILQLFDQHAQAQIKVPIERAHIHFRVVQDRDRNIQAMSIFTHFEQQIYLNLIMTAPWNLRMNAPILELHKPLTTKGGATSLIASLYRTAQDLHKSELRLKSMENSHTFYKDHLQMNEDSEGLFFSVTKDTPEQLKKFM